MKKYAALLTLLIMVNACEQNQKPVWPYGVNYEIYVMGFADGDGDGKGDIRGLTTKLDYLQETGFSALWLSPVMPSPSFHKYNITDYKAIDPDYGTIEDFKKMVDEAHKRGIRIIIDLLVNCTSSDHAWFKEAVKGKQNPFRRYYSWADREAVGKNESGKWREVKNDSVGQYFYSAFGAGMPSLNYDNPKVKDEMMDIVKFWLLEMDVDGFRLGAAEKIYPPEREKDNLAFWTWFKTEVLKIKPDVCLAGEVWSNAPKVATYLPGFTSTFNFDFHEAILALVKSGKDSANMLSKFVEIGSLYKSMTPEYQDATFIDNHDFDRILSELEDERKARMAAAILFSLPGTPYIFYGQEIGMKGKMPAESLREPFLWNVDKKDPAQTSWEIATYTTPQTVVPWAAQREDLNSMYHYYKNWIRYRNENEVLTFGELTSAKELQQGVIAFTRKRGTNSRLAVHNLTSEAVIIPTGKLDGYTIIEFTTSKETSITDKLSIPPFASVVLTNP